MQYFITQCGIDFSTALFLQFVFNTHLSLYRSITVKKILFKKRIPLVAVFGYDFFRTVTKTIMSSMIKPPDSNSHSNDSGTPSLSRQMPKTKHTKSHKYTPNIKSKILNLENKKTHEQITK